MTSPRYDAVVVGAGVVGAAAALLLARSGARTAVLERRAPQRVRGALGVDPRTLALSPASRRLLERIGGWPADSTADAPQPFRAMHVSDGDGGGSIRFTTDDLGQPAPALGYIVEQSALTTALWAALQSQPNVEVLEADEPAGLVDHDDAIELRLTSAGQLRTALLIAADGAASKTRELAGGAMDKQDTGQVALATIVEHALPHEDTAWQVFRASGPIAFLPLPDGVDDIGKPVHRSSVVWSCDAAYAETLTELADDAFATALGSAFGERLGAVLRIDARAHIPLVQQHARSYVPRARVVLIGDAAHVLHPLAGQGVNLGLRDARLLLEVVERAGIAALGRPATAQRYELRARSVNAGALGFMSGIQRLFASEHPLVRTVRSAGLSAVGRSRRLRRWFAQEAMGDGVLAKV